MKRVVATFVLAAGLASLAHAAMADEWGWHRRHRPWGREEVIMVYPPPPPPPSVVYMPAPVVMAPVQATPTSDTYLDRLGRYCREYQSTVIVGGMVRPSYGTACLQPDGSWQIVR